MPLAFSDIRLGFLGGIGLGLILTGGLIGYAAFNAPHTYEALSARLPEQILPLEKPFELDSEQAQPKAQDAADDETMPAPPSDAPSENAVFQTKPDITRKAEKESVYNYLTPDLYRQSIDGPIPYKGTDGAMPFDAYRTVPALKCPDNAGRLALVIKDFGLSSQLSYAILDVLPPDHTTLMLSPYASDSLGWSGEARARGFELWLQAPFNFPAQDSQGRDFAFDPGPLALSAFSTRDLNRENLAKVMGSAGAYAGMAINIPPQAANASPMLSDILETIHQRGLALFYSGVKAGDAGYPLPVLSATDDLSLAPSSLTMQQKIEGVLKDVQAGNSHILVIPALPASIALLTDMLDSAKRMPQICVHPLSSFYKANPDHKE